jgi:hypothetical protein
VGIDMIPSTPAAIHKEKSRDNSLKNSVHWRVAKHVIKDVSVPIAFFLWIIGCVILTVSTPSSLITKVALIYCAGLVLVILAITLLVFTRFVWEKVAKYISDVHEYEKRFVTKN